MGAAMRLRDVLRADLKAAMVHRRRDDANLLRSVIAAIDNAEAVPLPEGAKPADSASFASGGAEAARRVLTTQDLVGIIEAEVASRHAAAAQMRAGGAGQQAARLEEEAAQVADYLKALG